MRTKLVIILFLLSAFTGLGRGGALRADWPKPATYALDRERDPVYGRCVGVIDGDTIRVLTTGQELLKVRVAFIDCPEARQPFGTRAKQAMSRLVFGKDVELRPHTIDRYGRLVAMVYVDGIDAGFELLTAGLAWPFDRYLAQAPAEVQASYSAAVGRARDQRVGLWVDPEPIAPWQWRKGEQ
jgi:endonuclease YncB( thermonuclease family)